MQISKCGHYQTGNTGHKTMKIRNPLYIYTCIHTRIFGRPLRAASTLSGIQNECNINMLPFRNLKIWIAMFSKCRFSDLGISNLVFKQNVPKCRRREAPVRSKCDSFSSRCRFCTFATTLNNTLKAFLLVPFWRHFFRLLAQGVDFRHPKIMRKTVTNKTVTNNCRTH